MNLLCFCLFGFSFILKYQQVAQEGHLLLDILCKQTTVYMYKPIGQARYVFVTFQPAMHSSSSMGVQLHHFKLTLLAINVRKVVFRMLNHMYDTPETWKLILIHTNWWPVMEKNQFGFQLNLRSSYWNEPVSEICVVSFCLSRRCMEKFWKKKSLKFWCNVYHTVLNSLLIVLIINL